MNRSQSSDAVSTVGSENVTDFMLAPGETSVYGQRFIVSLLFPFLKAEMMCSSSRFVYKVPNTLFGIIPIGSEENTFPISAISAVTTAGRFRFGRAFLALILLIFGFAFIDDYPVRGAILLLLSVVFALTSYSTALVVTNHAGGSFGLEISFIESRKLRAFTVELQNRVFADWEATRHGEAQEIRMQTLAMQQMQLAQMQQAQMQQQLQPQQRGQFPQGQPQMLQPQQSGQFPQGQPQMLHPQQGGQLPQGQPQMQQQLQPQQSGQFPQGQPQTQSLQNQPGYTEQISQQGQMPPVPPPSPDQGQ